MKTNFHRHLINYWHQIHYLISFLTFPWPPHFLFLYSSKFLQPRKTFQRPRFLFFFQFKFWKVKNEKGSLWLDLSLLLRRVVIDNAVRPTATLVTVRLSRKLSSTKSIFLWKLFPIKTNLTNWGFFIKLTGFFCFPLLLNLQVDSARRHGILLEAVQVLTDLSLSIKKAYISSDGRWFMDGKRKKNSSF